MILNILNILKIIVSSIFILFLPGYCLSYVFFRITKLDIVERSILAFALSIAILPIMIFYTNILGAPINAETIIVQVSAFSTLVLLIIIARCLLSKINEK